MVFGQGAGLDFSTLPPTFFFSKSLKGSSSAVSDAKGNLIFYTSGAKIYNAKGGLISQHLKVDSKVRRAVIIVPDPKNKKRYYIFSIGSDALSPGLFYTIYVPGQTPTASVKLSSGDFIGLNAVYALDKKSLWVVTAVRESDKISLRAYRLSASLGLVSAPVLSSVEVRSADLNFGLSQRITATISASGQRYALSFEKDKRIFTAVFDTDTGQMKNKEDLRFNETPLGMTFTRSDQYLYVSLRDDVSKKAFLRRYEVLGFPASHDKLEVATLKLSDYPEIPLKNPPHFEGLQLGLHGSIYAAIVSPSPKDLGLPEETAVPASYLGRVANPEGKTPELNPKSILLRNALGRAFSTGEFPNMVQTFFSYSATRKLLACQGQVRTLVISSSSIVLYTVAWDFGDPASGRLNTSKELSGAHRFSAVGDYLVKARYTSSIGNGVAQGTVRALPPPRVDLGVSNRVVCAKRPLELDAGKHLTASDRIASIYSWSHGLFKQKIQVDKPGFYRVDVRSGFCTASDSVEVFPPSKLALDLGADRSLCAADVLKLDGGRGLSSHRQVRYRWQDISKGSATLSTARHHTIRNSGEYVLTLSNGCDALRDTIRVRYPLDDLKLDLGGDTLLCQGQTLRLDAGKDLTDKQRSSVRYLWGDGTAGRYLTVRKSGKYRVDISHLGCAISDEIAVGYVPEIRFDFQVDTALCEGTPYRVDVSQYVRTSSKLPLEYRWSDGNTAAVRTFHRAVDLGVRVGVGSCFSEGRLKIRYTSAPRLSLRDTSLCYTRKALVLDAGLFDRYAWSNGAETRTITVRDTGQYHVDLSQGICRDRVSVRVERNWGPVFELRVRDRNVQVDVFESRYPPYEYSLDGEHYRLKNRFERLPPGIHHLWVRDATGCVAKSSDVEILALDIPKFFTPNGDGINDYWQVKGLEWYEGLHRIYVYDRYGEEVYRYRSGDSGWDGGALPPSDYWYVIDINHGTKVLKGHFTLLRD